MILRALQLLFISLLTATPSFAQYVCTPCKDACDTLNFSGPGVCPHCKMKLVLKASVTAAKEGTLSPHQITAGSGQFLFRNSKNGKDIIVHYYYPKAFTKKSDVIFIIPGAGRNGDTYRDAWIEYADKYNLLVLSPEYSDNNYPGFWNYNLAGMIKNVKINKDKTGIESYEVNLNADEWILDDFDEIFIKVKDELKLKTDTYDLFGHSAGGQLLHRLAMYKPRSKANRILASNSGWYTVPDPDDVFPYGLKNSTATPESLKQAFACKLVVFLGEKDDANETRGDLVRSPEVDKQGTYRLARGEYFFKQAEKYAKELGADFNWQLVVVPNVGHDHVNMSKAAAKYLYDGKRNERSR